MFLGFSTKSPTSLEPLLLPEQERRDQDGKVMKKGTIFLKLELLGHHFYCVPLGTSANTGALCGGQHRGWDLRGHLGGYHNAFSFMFSMTEAVLK